VVNNMKRTGISSMRVPLRGFAALGIVIVFAAGAARAYDRDETLQKNLPLQGAKRIVVTNSRGTVKVIGAKGRSDVLCEYRKSVRHRDQDQADRLFDLMDVEVERKGTDLLISASYPDRPDRDRGIIALLMQHIAGMSIDMNITVPADIGVEIVTASGDVEVASVLGPCAVTSASGRVEAVGVGSLRVDVSSGDITVSGVAGAAVLSSSSGEIEAHAIKGTLSVRSTSGDIAISDVDGDVGIETSSGDVTVEGAGSIDYSGTNGSARFSDVRGAVTAIAASGDIDVDAVPESVSNYEIRTSSGQIGLTFQRPMKGGFALKVRTTSGDISTTLPITVTRVGRHYLMGVVRDGKAVVVLETASGDIDVSESGE
jgi:DUF4097 and DUF4098 domain-containing protein YvlB